MILGNKLSIEFRSYPHNQKKGPPGGYRGGFGGGRGGAHNSGRREDESASRWGYKLTIRPIFGDPIYSIKPVPISKDVYNEVMKKIGQDAALSVVNILNQVVFFSSRLAAQLMQA